MPFGFIGILIGLFGLTSSTDPGTSDWPIMGWLFVTGLGMGATMMPLFTSALKTLKAADVARGSTLLNVTQQVASATGIATISVVLTNAMKSGDVLAGSEKLPGVDGGLTAAQLAAGSHTDGRRASSSTRSTRAARFCSRASRTWRTRSRRPTGSPSRCCSSR